MAPGIINFVCSSMLVLLSASAGAGAALAETLSEQLSKPIPEPHTKAEMNYHGVPFDLENPKYKEPLVPLSKYGIAGEAFYARKDGLNAPYYRCICPESESESLQLRKTVAEKLQHINRKLSLLGVELYVYDAYRPVSCQTKLWNYFIDEARKKLGSAAPEEEVIKYAGTYCGDPRKFNPDDWKTWPSHSTGGAVDLTLKRKNGELLFMGSIFDDDSEITHSDHFEKESKSSKLPVSYAEALKNRRILYNAMIEEGFINYHSEWWHYEYGTQMWALVSAQKDQKAFYGTVYNGEIK